MSECSGRSAQKLSHAGEVGSTNASDGTPTGATAGRSKLPRANVTLRRPASFLDYCLIPARNVLGRPSGEPETANTQGFNITKVVLTQGPRAVGRSFQGRGQSTTKAVRRDGRCESAHESTTGLPPSLRLRNRCGSFARMTGTLMRRRILALSAIAL